MNLPTYFPAWMYLYFAVFGSAAIVLLSLVFWNWMKVNRLSKGFLRTALKWNAAGYVFMFSAAWFACGIGAGPGNLLSLDVSMHNPFLASMSAVSGMFASVAGWVCLLVGQRILLIGLKQDGKKSVEDLQGVIRIGSELAQFPAEASVQNFIASTQ